VGRQGAVANAPADGRPIAPPPTLAAATATATPTTSRPPGSSATATSRRRRRRHRCPPLPLPPMCAFFLLLTRLSTEGGDPAPSHLFHFLVNGQPKKSERCYCCVSHHIFCTIGAPFPPSSILFAFLWCVSEQDISTGSDDSPKSGADRCPRRRPSQDGGESSVPVPEFRPCGPYLPSPYVTVRLRRPTPFYSAFHHRHRIPRPTAPSSPRSSMRTVPSTRTSPWRSPRATMDGTPSNCDGRRGCHIHERSEGPLLRLWLCQVYTGPEAALSRMRAKGSLQCL